MRSYVHLSADERLRIYQLSREGLSQAEIARRLGRHKGTISRELRRNEAPAGYLPDLAQRRYQARRQRCRPRLRLAERTLRRGVILLLEQGWAPQPPFTGARPRPPPQRPQTGHWETDSLLFPEEQALNVLVDRLSRFTVLTR